MPTLVPLPHADSSNKRESGFTLIELIIALFIISIILGLALTTLRGSKNASYYRVGIATASSYADAVEAFMVDNGQVVPKIGDATWPNAKRGPIDAMMNGRPYMRIMPDAIENGLATLVPAGTNPTSGQVAIEYITYPAMPSDYTFRVRTLHGDPMVCVVTNRGNVPSSERRCE